MNGSNGLSGRAAELRRAFDRSFAEAPGVASAPLEDLITVRIGGDGYALLLAECAGLFADRKVTRLPTRVPALLGLAGFRGALVPVYDLRVLLGYPGGHVPRWLVTTARSTGVALAFDAFEAHVRVDRGALVADDTPAQPHADRVVHLQDGARRVLRLSRVLDAIEARTRSDRQGA